MNIDTVVFCSIMLFIKCSIHPQKRSLGATLHTNLSTDEVFRLIFKTEYVRKMLLSP